MSEDPRPVVERYFACIRAGDPAVADLFCEDATIQGLGMRTQGRGAIADFHAGVIAGVRPRPSPKGGLARTGNRVMAEIGLADGGRVHAVDVFVIEEGQIRSLTYFTADLPTEPPQA